MNGFFNSKSSFIENSKRSTREGVSKKNTFVGLLIELTEIVLIVVENKTFASEYVEECYVWFPPLEQFVRSLLENWSNIDTVTYKACRVNRLRPKVLRQI